MTQAPAPAHAHHLLAHIGHLEITAPDVDASVAFYEEHLGLTTIERKDGKAYLRCWGDYYTESFPPVDGAHSATEEGIVPGTEDALLSREALIQNPYAQPGRG